jgi:transglutaminase-like putative cysteine protease
MAQFPPLNITVRVGCNVVYETSSPTPIVFVVKPCLDSAHFVREERLSFGPGLPSSEYVDVNGNINYRAMLMPGRNAIQHDALVAVSSEPENYGVENDAVPVENLRSELLRYTLPSRYCDSDKLMNFAWEHFGKFRNGVERVQAICDWIHKNIEYRYFSGNPELSASDILARGYGVCRDFAHIGIALCRAFNLPARYVTGHLPDIGFTDSGMDFHAYMEVYLGGNWYTFDPRFNVPRIGRVKISQGLDGVDGAFATIYGEARLVHFEVWAYQVTPGSVSLGDPIDLSKRIDGTTEVRLS